MCVCGAWSTERVKRPFPWIPGPLIFPHTLYIVYLVFVNKRLFISIFPSALESVQSPRHGQDCETCICIFTIRKLTPVSGASDVTALFYHTKKYTPLFPQNALCCFPQHGTEPTTWVQEVMSVCVPVRDKSDIPTKPFPKINIQNRSPVCVHILIQFPVFLQQF